MDELQRAKALREQAGRLEEIGRVKKRLLDLIEISQDPYYDQYLKQMLKDLEEGISASITAFTIERPTPLPP